MARRTPKENRVSSVRVHRDRKENLVNTDKVLRDHREKPVSMARAHRDLREKVSLDRDHRVLTARVHNMDKEEDLMVKLHTMDKAHKARVQVSLVDHSMARAEVLTDKVRRVSTVRASMVREHRVTVKARITDKARITNMASKDSMDKEDSMARDLTMEARDTAWAKAQELIRTRETGMVSRVMVSRVHRVTVNTTRDTDKIPETRVNTADTTREWADTAREIMVHRVVIITTRVVNMVPVVISTVVRADKARAAIMNSHEALEIRADAEVTVSKVVENMVWVPMVRVSMARIMVHSAAAVGMKTADAKTRTGDVSRVDHTDAVVAMICTTEVKDMDLPAMEEAVVKAA
jgi:hypothetical protein